MSKRSERVEISGAYVTNEFHTAILLSPVFLRTALACSCGYHLERGSKPLHDAVGINCEKGTTTENQGAGIKYCIWAKVCMLMIVCVLSDLT